MRWFPEIRESQPHILHVNDRVPGPYRNHEPVPSGSALANVRVRRWKEIASRRFEEIWQIPGDYS